MLIKVLLAEDNELMRKCIARLLQEEPNFELVGVATNFAQTMQMTADFKPKVLLMDLHLPEERDFTPAFVKSQLSSIPLLAISVAVDDEAQALAASYGARLLLDKMKLYEELIPAITKFAKPTSNWSDSQFASPNFSECDTA